MMDPIKAPCNGWVRFGTHRIGSPNLNFCMEIFYIVLIILQSMVAGFVLYGIIDSSIES